MPRSPTGELVTTIERAADVSMAGLTLQLRGGEPPPLNEDAVRQRFVRLTTLILVCLLVPGAVLIRLFFGPGVLDNTALAIAGAYGLCLGLVHLWSRLSTTSWPGFALIALLIGLPAAIAAVAVSPLVRLSSTVLLVVPVIAASSLIGHWQGVIVAAIGAALTVTTSALVTAASGDPTVETIARLWTSRVLATILVAAAVGWFFSRGLRQLIEALRGANRRLAARARRQGTLASLGQRALASYDALVRATLDKVPVTLDIDLCAYAECVRADEWVMTLPGSRRPRRCTVPLGSPLRDALSLAGPHLIHFGADAPDDRLAHSRCLVVATTLGSGKRAALLACTREQQALGDDEVPFLETVLNILSAAAGRERAETLQSRSEARYADLVALSPDGIVTIDGDGVVTSCNPAAAALVGQPAPAVIGRRFIELGIFEGEEVRRAERGLLRVRGEAELGSIALWIRRSDGDRRRIEVNGQRTIQGDGAAEIVAILRDVTERHLLEEQLRQAQRLESLGLLAGGVAHDFNNLLTVVLTSAALLRDDSRVPADAIELAAEIHDAGERAATLTRQLLAFSRRQVLSPRPLDLSQVVAELERMLRRVIGEDIALIVDLEAALGTVHVDRSQVEQALINLCVNARAAMPRGGQLTLSTRRRELDEIPEGWPPLRPGPYVHLRVADTGQGIDEAVLPRIFEPFFTTKGPGEGTGLGLAMVHGFVQQSGGHVWAESTVGHGSVFHVLLPIVDGEIERGIPTPPPGLRRGAGHVLLIEDEPLVRTVAARILDHAGYRVTACEGPQEALSRFDAAAHDLVISDVVMPGMSGIEVLRRLRERHPGLRALLISGYPRLPEGESEALGHIDLVQKPFSPETLTAAVERALRAAPRRPAAYAP